MKVNAYIYQLIYALNKTTSVWLKNTNNKIKNKGIEILSCNEDKNIFISERKAQDKYAPEIEAKIQEIKDANTPINEGEKVLVINVEHISKSTQNKVNKILDTLENNQDNKVIQRVANIIKTTNKK